jgi:Lrp/AsnC family transcriptional regulator, regulator for asnA, asnC and gidA
MSNINLDEIDRSILDLLGQDGRLSIREVGRQLDLPEASARARVARLQKHGLLKHWLQIHSRVSKKLASAYIGVHTHPLHARSVADAISVLPGCFFVGISLGQFDVFTYFLTSSRAELYRTIRTSLETLPGVTGLSVREVMEVVKHPLQIGSTLDDEANDSTRSLR